ncbi:MAG: homoserine kinase [Candidatus Omnitrophota bacterium]|jgi:homoserine kinase|nr:MAG: homoserine kinase [Candidatus Omnitrophota bacterium]
MKTIHLTVPASSGNLGPGFDTLGIAVTLHNEFQIEPSADTQLEIRGGIDPALHDPCAAMMRYAGDYFFAQTKLPQIHFKLTAENRIPIARGLASSGTMRLAVLVGLNELCAAHLSNNDIVKMAAELEGCTDNVSSSFYGGLAASGIVDGKLVCYHFDLPDELDFIAVWPKEAVETDKARTVFPPTLPRDDAIFNTNRATLLTLAFLNRDYDRMAALFDDRLHQPYRQAAIPALKPLYDIIQAAKVAGAIGGYLSGSGSTVMAVALTNGEAIAHAMQNAFRTHNMKSEYRLLKADNQGLKWKEENKFKTT